MDPAEAWLVKRGGRDGVILTTDADSQVAPDWIAELVPPSRLARGEDVCDDCKAQDALLWIKIGWPNSVTRRAPSLVLDAQ